MAVNADYKEEFAEEYRKNILQLASETKNCFPVLFPTFTSLSKMWNTVIINSTNEFILMLNDDIEFENENILDTVKSKIAEIKKLNELSTELFLINESWAHFVASKKIIDRLGYFDERLLAFGEEDGDMVWRYIKIFGKRPENIKIDGLSNVQEGYKIPHPNMQVEDIKDIRFVPKFNRDFINKKYKRVLFGIKGMFDHKVKAVIPNLKQYPYEKFKRENYEKM